jgi:hypothetical protein
MYYLRSSDAGCQRTYRRAVCSNWDKARKTYCDVKEISGCGKLRKLMINVNFMCSILGVDLYSVLQRMAAVDYAILIPPPH